MNKAKVAEKRGRRQNEKPFLFFSTKKTLAQKKEREREEEGMAKFAPKYNTGFVNAKT